METFFSWKIGKKVEVGISVAELKVRNLIQFVSQNFCQMFAVTLQFFWLNEIQKKSIYFFGINFVSTGLIRN